MHIPHIFGGCMRALRSPVNFRVGNILRISQRLQSIDSWFQHLQTEFNILQAGQISFTQTQTNSIFNRTPRQATIYQLLLRTSSKISTDTIINQHTWEIVLCRVTKHTLSSVKKALWLIRMRIFLQTQPVFPWKGSYTGFIIQTHFRKCN